jgi:DNA-directed RNA polymerase sigma subunit (sigma70/sigma32)
MSNPKPETLALLTQINVFLGDLYGAPRRLSDILRDQGVRDEDIARLRRDHLDAYLVEFLRRCMSWMAEKLPERRSEILARCYGLDGNPKSTLTSLAGKYGISRERVRQLRQSALRRMQHRKRRQELKQLAVEAAQSLLYQGDAPD